MKKEDTSVHKRKHLLAKLKAYEERLLAQLKRPNYEARMDR